MYVDEVVWVRGGRSDHSDVTENLKPDCCHAMKICCLGDQFTLRPINDAAVNDAIDTRGRLLCNVASAGQPWRSSCILAPYC